MLNAIDGTRSLRRDQTGAVLVLGLMLGAFLVGILFHVVGVGHSILWRELAQDAADNAAYEAAVWNARGMNVIVVLNIFMAVVMAVLIAWRLVMAFLAGLIVLGAIACGASLIPGLQFLAPACAAVPPATYALRTMVQQDPKVAGRVYQIISMLHQGQKVVASATPILSVARSTMTTLDRYDVDFAAGVGSYLLPTRGLSLKPKPKKDDTRSPGSCPRCERCEKNKGGTTNRDNKNPGKRRRRSDLKVEDYTGLLGAPVSLPVVEDEDVSTLCEKGGRLQALLVFELIGWLGENLPPPGDFLKQIADGGDKWSKIWGYVTGALSTYLCEDPIGALTNLADGAEDQQCQGSSKCKDETSSGRGDPADTGYNGKAIGKDSEQHKGRTITSDDLRWTNIWPFAANGNLFLQSWGVVRSERQDKTALDNALKIADSFGGAGELAEVDEKAIVLAQAEMFYDCDKGWASCWLSAPWTINWRARLRRVHDPLEMASGQIEAMLIDTLWYVLGDPQIAQHIPGVETLQAAIEGLDWRLVPALPTDGSREIREEIADRAESNGRTSPAQWVLDSEAQDVAELVH